jgi:hypothetical protein
MYYPSNTRDQKRINRYSYNKRLLFIYCHILQVGLTVLFSGRPLRHHRVAVPSLQARTDARHAQH